MTRLPIGVFDSGVGGLTVLRALRAALPGESFLYLGDTARLPYGTKSPGTISRYALQAARVLVDRGIDSLVIACNTASAVALEDVRAAFPDLDVTGVVEPGAAAACQSSSGGAIAVIGTESTIRGGAYAQAIARLRPDARVTGLACPLFVALAEEGWTEGPIPEAVAREYLTPIMDGIDTLVLGCTHFPLLAGPIAATVGEAVTIVDSAATTAERVRAALQRRGFADSPADASRSTICLMATDGRERFARVGSRFLGVELQVDAVELVDL
ncbi:MAG: glutamate racemase [Deltaproteobacteria bacterium]|nr:glutamate racemase [Nannocystaceae bacterium]